MAIYNAVYSTNAALTAPPLAAEIGWIDFSGLDANKVSTKEQIIVNQLKDGTIVTILVSSDVNSGF